MMKIEKLIKITKPLNKTELKKVIGGNDSTANSSSEEEQATSDGIIQDDLLIG